MSLKKKRQPKTSDQRKAMLCKRFRQVVLGLICLSAVASAAVGLTVVDTAVRANLPSNTPPLWQLQEEQPLRYSLHILGRSLGFDFTPIAAVAEEGAAVLTTPPAPVRIALWLWLQLSSQGLL